MNKEIVEPPVESLAGSMDARRPGAAPDPRASAALPAPTDAVAKTKTDRSAALSDLLAAAYSRASKVEISAEESRRLREPFPDDVVRRGARGRDNLLYIEHSMLSDRLTDVLGMGKWALLRRSERLNDNVIYVDCVLLIRGAYAGESLGESDYNPRNPVMGYTDALKAAESNALSRICQRLGIGSQVWDKSFCEAWLARQQEPAPAKKPAATAEDEMSYFRYSDGNQYRVKRELHENTDVIEVCPWGKSKGKRFDSLPENSLIGHWSVAHDMIEEGKNIETAVGVLKTVASLLFAKGHTPHAIFE